MMAGAATGDQHMPMHDWIRVEPSMPLFLEPHGCIRVPLEATYQTAYAVLPRRWQRVLD
jgi:hypothetical protein